MLQYAEKRNITLNSSLVKEVHWNNNNKSYFAIGFKNNKGGYDLRNEVFKGKIGENSITSGAIGKDNKNIAIFEGMSDYLSFRKQYPKTSFDFIVLNSTSNTDKAIQQIPTNKNIFLYLDNDPAGDKATNKFLKQFPNAQDKRNSYKNSKDINEHLSKLKKLKKEVKQTKKPNKGMSI